MCGKSSKGPGRAGVKSLPLTLTRLPAFFSTARLDVQSTVKFPPRPLAPWPTPESLFTRWIELAFQPSLQDFAFKAPLRTHLDAREFSLGHKAINGILIDS